MTYHLDLYLIMNGNSNQGNNQYMFNSFETVIC